MTVVVTDVNDNAPRFRSPPVFFVREHAPNGSLVGVVEALDPDAGWNAQVHYRIVPESHPQAVFLIDPVFGYLQVRYNTVNGRLDGARQRLYHLTLEAFDSGLATVHVSTMQITVVVMKSDCDSGDSAEDTKWILNDTFYGKVLENATLGQPVVQVLAESGAGDAGDKTDDGDGADVKLFEIEGGDPRGVFEIGSRSGLITTRKHLDADLESRYNLSVSVRHSIDAPKQITRVLIEVGDLNDESPRFVNTGGDHWLLRLAENLRGPFPIHLGTTLAEDRDNWSSRNVSSTIAYAILQGNTSLFAVDPQTGRLMLLAPLDRELQSEHRLLIQALDLGDGPQRRPQAPSATATLHVTILVEDQNDNWPHFELPQYQAWIEENGEVGQLVARIQASDADCGENARLR
ncbi:unnamed protein product [Anisakis simplex]|uniref:Cadherin domain-containing protein n=1 Tax=Anisakis simplex TaxID=6269 RepID=A0A3P6SWI7_ANISI|nr:unnamed protein product [Anisakis simplex]